MNPGAFAALPAPGLVDTLPMRTEVDIVGYGVQGFIRGGGPPQQIFTAIRFFAPSLLVQSNNRSSDEFIKLTANPAQGQRRSVLRRLRRPRHPERHATWSSR